MEANLYQILGLQPTASLSEIKAAYRELVKQHHPDAGGGEEKILAINAAWAVLGDPENRKKYDYTLNQKVSFLEV